MPTTDLPDGFVWAGGTDTGIYFGAPADWVERDDLGGDLRRRGGIAYLDPIGAAIPALFEGHLIASCRGLRGITTAEQLAARNSQSFAEHANLVMDVVIHNGHERVRAEYDSESTAGEIEHWYVYDLVASPGRACRITLVTPLSSAERQHIGDVFEAVGSTVEVADR